MVSKVGKQRQPILLLNLISPYRRRVISTLKALSIINPYKLRFLLISAFGPMCRPVKPNPFINFTRKILYSTSQRSLRFGIVCARPFLFERILYFYSSESLTSLTPLFAHLFPRNTNISIIFIRVFRDGLILSEEMG